jgi:hypothetical protein
VEAVGTEVVKPVTQGKGRAHHQMPSRPKFIDQWAVGLHAQAGYTAKRMKQALKIPPGTRCYELMTRYLRLMLPHDVIGFLCQAKMLLQCRQRAACKIFQI